MPKASWPFLFLLVFSVYSEDQDLPVVASTKELKGIKAKKIMWKKDGAKMVRIPLEIVTPAKTGTAVYESSVI